MAMSKQAYPSPSETDWRARDDHSTLKRAAEVFADKTRMNGVLKEMKREKCAEDCLEDMIKKYKRTGKLM